MWTHLRHVAYCAPRPGTTEQRQKKAAAVDGVWVTALYGSGSRACTGSSGERRWRKHASRRERGMAVLPAANVPRGQKADGKDGTVSTHHGTGVISNVWPCYMAGSAWRSVPPRAFCRSIIDRFWNITMGRHPPWEARHHRKIMVRCLVLARSGDCRTVHALPQ